LGEAAGAELVVNATPLGMGADTRLPLDANLLHAGQTVVDLVYDPPVTPLLAEAARRGAVAVNGVGMLVHQAALAFRLWTGLPPPVDEMRSALREAFN
jgi:shikimate dehydrogenase